MPRLRNPAAPLKKKLARSAYGVIREVGVEDLTIKAVAKGANVTANAPYHHYKEGAVQLIAAAAVLGFHDLREALGRHPITPWARDRVSEVVLRYVEFGVRNANIYRAMFHKRIAKPLEARTTPKEREATYAQLFAVKRLAYDDVIAPLVRLHLEGDLRGGQEPGDAPGLALAALAHGLVGEFIDEGLLPPKDAREPWTAERQEMTAEVTNVLLLGLLADSTAGRTEAEERAPPAPEDDPSWRLYARTILEFFPSDRSVAIDLRDAPPPESVESVHDRGLPESFAVLTAWNPRGRTVTDEDNRRRDRELKARLCGARQTWVPVDGVSSDGRHREPGVGVALSQEDARRLACDFEQSAFYWFDEGAFWLVGALVQTAPVRLPA